MNATALANGARPSSTLALSAGVIICAYTQARWDDLSAAVAELQRQVRDDDEIIVVIDHNDELLARSEREFAAHNVMVVANAGTQGLSGARNTGVSTCTSDITIFLDDDALPGPGWVDSYRAKFAGADDIAGVGGAVTAAWEGGSAPRWFPAEFGWVVGCDYRGLPDGGQEIRNPIGASMAIRQSYFNEIGGFSEAVGRVGTVPAGCEETELCIRLRQDHPDIRIIRDTDSVVYHRVPKARQTVKYFTSRCYHEGRSKAAMTSIVGSADGLSSERSYVVKTLVRGIGINLAAVGHGDIAGIARAVMLPVGLAATTFGYGLATVSAKRAARKAAK